MLTIDLLEDGRLQIQWGTVGHYAERRHFDVEGGTMAIYNQLFDATFPGELERM